MEYEEFVQQVLDRIKDFLPDQYAGADISLIQKVKVNDIVHDGLVIQTPENDIMPAIYLNSFYEGYQYGWDMESILQRIADAWEDSLKQESVDLSAKGFEFGQVKDRITCSLVNIESNSLFLADRPYTRMEDLAVVYDIHMGKTEYENRSISINKSMLEGFGVEIEELHNIALENMDRISPYTIKSQVDLLRDMGFPPALVEKTAEQLKKSSNPHMLWISDEKDIFGAAVALNDKAMQEIAERFGGDFYVLPASTREMFVVPMDREHDFTSFEAVVRDINEADMRPSEKLSDHVYEYHAMEHELVRCDWAEERKVDRNLAEEKKPSIKEQLSMPPVAGKRSAPKPELAR